MQPHGLIIPQLRATLLQHKGRQWEERPLLGGRGGRCAICTAGGAALAREGGLQMALEGSVMGGTRGQLLLGGQRSVGVGGEGLPGGRREEEKDGVGCWSRPHPPTTTPRWVLRHLGSMSLRPSPGGAAKHQPRLAAGSGREI